MGTGDLSLGLADAGSFQGILFLFIPFVKGILIRLKTLSAQRNGRDKSGRGSVPAVDKGG